MNCCHVAFAGLVAWTINSVIQHIRIVKVETKERKLEIRTKELEKKNGKELKKIEELEKIRKEDKKIIDDLQKEVQKLKSRS
jgi:uncharacterized coiled-coil protein SlyX